MSPCPRRSGRGVEGEFGHCSFKNAVLRNLSPSSDCRTATAGGGTRKRKRERDTRPGSAQPPAKCKAQSGPYFGLVSLPHAWGGGPHRLTDELEPSPCLGARVRGWAPGSLSRVKSGWRIQSALQSVRAVQPGLDPGDTDADFTALLIGGGALILWGLLR